MDFKKFDSLDDILLYTYKKTLANDIEIEGKRGSILELHNFAFTLNNPRSRTSSSLDRRLVKSKFAEFAWYLSADPDKTEIVKYIDAYNKEEAENKKILGAYGPKIFGNVNKVSQYDRVVGQLKKRMSSKQAYICISEIENYKIRTEKFASPPCTIGLHFLVRDKKLHLTAFMRSNDAYYGLPHDLFCFTMLQEMLSIELQLELGTYSHVCTSMHIYKKNLPRVKKYIEEGHFEMIEMPEMQNLDDDQRDIVTKAFMKPELELDIQPLPPYWKDYSFFSFKYQEENLDNWISKFSTVGLKNIAINSITD